MKKLLALIVFVPAVANAQTVTPNFTQGSMQATTTTTTTIDRTIETEVMGGAYSSWSGTNVTPSGDITNIRLRSRCIPQAIPFNWRSQRELQERSKR